MIDEKLIQGAGGGSKSGSASSRTPTEEDDSLKSEQFVSVLDLLC